MLTLTGAQMQALSEVVLDQLIETAVDHIQTALPTIYEDLGRSEVRESVRVAIQKAGRYGLERWPEVVRYLNVMYMLGFDFDDDPRYPWAHPTLSAPDLSDTAKMDALTGHALRECEAAHSAAGV